jgi:hypothetical protein
VSLPILELDMPTFTGIVVEFAESPAEMTVRRHESALDACSGTRVVWTEQKGKTMKTVTHLGMVAILFLAGGSAVLATDADNGTSVADPPAVGTVGDSNTRNDPWVALRPCPYGVSRPAGAVVGGHFYIIGGEPRDGYVQEYDPGTGLWDATNALTPTPVSNVCVAVVGTDIYLPGGYTGSYIDTLQVYHTTTDTWEVVATDPVPAALSGPACTGYNGRVYVFGGRTASAYEATTYIYDPAAAPGSRWTSGATIPVAAGYGDAIAVGGYLYYAGMRNSSADLADVHRYDPVADAWVAMPSLTTPRGGARMWAYEGNLAVGGGGWSSYLNSVEVYDLSTGTGGTWTTGNSLIAGSRTFAAAQDWINGYLYKGAGWAAAYQTAAESSFYIVPVELMSLTVE